MKYDVVVYLLVAASADRIIARFARDGFAMSPRSAKGYVVGDSDVSHILMIAIETPHATAMEAAEYLAGTLRQMEVPYFGGDVSTFGKLDAVFLPGYMPKPKSKQKPGPTLTTVKKDADIIQFPFPKKDELH